MRFMTLLLLLFSLTACLNSPPKNYEVPEYEKMADRITHATAKKIESSTGLRLMGTGGGAINHIRKLNMAFMHLGKLQVDQGRELVVYCVNEYLSAINANEEIRPFLIHYPFTPEDVEIEIFVYQSDRYDVPIGDLAVIAEAYGKVVYKIRKPYPDILERTRVETYDEAVSLLEAKKS